MEATLPRIPFNIVFYKNQLCIDQNIIDNITKLILQSGACVVNNNIVIFWKNAQQEKSFVETITIRFCKVLGIYF